MASVNDFTERGYMFMSTFGFRIVVSTVTHPFEYAKFLIQIGHEPMPSFASKTLLGKPARALPNIFKYVKYIKNTDGVLGCYRGFGPKITGQILSSLIAESVTKSFKVDAGFDPKEDEVSDEVRWTHFKQTLIKDVIGRSVTIIVSQPFYVISARMMAQFVGGEQIYNGFLNALKEIYKNEGILGFFTGLIPKWFGEISALLLSSFAIYGINTYIIQDNELKGFTATTMQFLSYSLTYPFTVVSACTVVNNCGLAAGIPPQMPIFDSWTHCWRHLHQTSQLNRGSNTLFRYCPQTVNKLS